MDEELLAERFQQQRARLRTVAERLLGTSGEADDAVQETWLRLQRTGADGIDNLDGWLTTVLARVCLNMLRARRTRREEALDAVWVVEPAPEQQDPAGPEERALLARRPRPTRQLVSRARRKVRSQAPAPDTDLARRRAVVDAFLAAAHRGDLDRLVELMHPDVVLRSEGGRRRPAATMVVRGARPVASSTRTYARLAPSARPVLVDGAVGVVVAPGGRPFSVMAFTVVDGRVAAIDVLADPDRIARLALPG